MVKVASKKPLKLRCFRFGEDPMPWWFIQLVANGAIEVIVDPEAAVTKSFVFTNTYGVEQEVKAGTLVTADMLYDEEPTRTGEVYGE